MKLKNAGFESELDMMTALVGGETVYFDLSSEDRLDIKSLFFASDGSLSSDYIGLNFNLYSTGELIQLFKEAKVECKWYENITWLVPCWVWNLGEKKQIALIRSYGDVVEFKFTDSLGYAWKNAIPLEVSDLLGGDDDSE